MKKLFNLYTILFIVIVLVAILFRFMLLNSVPPSGSLDEVSIGWNAYAILLTGKGEYGRSFPIIMQAYDDFRPAGYLYLVIPFVKLLGLTVLAVRLPSAILSLVTVIASFFLAKIVVRGYKYEKWVSLTVMGLFAISPFHIYISRLGHEVNPGLTFAFLGVLFFLWGLLSERKWLVILSGIFWAGSLYTYQSEKVFVPLIVVTLLGLFYKQVFQNKKVVIASLLLALVLSLPIVFASLQPGALLRLKGTSVFTDQRPFIETSLRLAEATKHHDLVGEITYNRRFVPVSVFLWNYLPHFSPEWWLGNSGLERFKAPGFGLSYQWELPLFLLGLFFLWRLPVSLPLKILPIVWILIAFVAPGITTETPHAMRSFNILPIPQLLEGIGCLGVVALLGNIKNYGKQSQILFVGLIGACVVVSIVQFSQAYFVTFVKQGSAPYQCALHRAMKYVILHQKEYSHIVVSNQANATQSYMFYLFESKYDPKKYQNAGGTKSGGFREFHHIDNIDFIPVAKDIKLEQNTLYIGNVTDGKINVLPDNITIVQQFTGLGHVVRLVAFVAK